MRSLFLVALAGLVAAPAIAADPTEGMKKGTPPVKSVSAIAFGPGGVLFVGDPASGAIFAVATDDTKPAGKGDVNVEKLGDAVGSALGTTAANVTVSDVKVNPASGNIYLAITRGKGKDAAPVIAMLNRDGKFSVVEMSNVMFSMVSLPNVSGGQSITSLAYVGGKVYAAGLSTEEFASTFRTISFPFTSADKGAGIEIFHGAHGKLETKAPIRTFVAYKIGEAEHILAAYTCTPLVKLPVTDLKPGAKVKGTTIAELGSGNAPLDMVVYNKDGKDYVLIANTRRGVMKVAADQFAGAEAISTPVKGGQPAGVKYETIKELTGVMQMDKLDDSRALVLIEGADKSLTLKSVPLP